MSIATVLLIAIALVIVVGTLVAVIHDGYRRIPNAPILRQTDEARSR